MKYIAAILICAALVGGCSSTDRNKALGNWAIDPVTETNTNATVVHE